MRQPHQVVILLLLLGLVAAGFWWFLQSDDDDAAGVTTTATGHGDDPTERGDGETGPGPERVTPSRFPGETSPEGSEASKKPGPAELRLKLTWPGDAPARDVYVMIQGTTRAQGYGTLARHRSGDDGVVTFAGLRAGKWSLRTDRNDRKTVEYEGGVQEVPWELKPGVTVEGVVVDEHDAPVGGASVWLQSHVNGWTGGRIIGRADDLGAFRLEQVPTDLSLAAIASGHVPSELVDLDLLDTERPPVRVKLKLRGKGADLVATVEDTAGKPVAGAEVAIGERGRYRDERGGRTVEFWSCRVEKTDARGRVRFDGIAPGPLAVNARHPSRGRWRGEVTLEAGKTEALTIRMPRAGSVAGW